jgi:hypothetical protein
MFYAAKCYWPGVTEEELQRVVACTAPDAGATPSDWGEIVSLGSMLFPNDALALCLFDAASGAAVLTEAVRAGMPCDRVMELVWLRPQRERSAIRLKRGKETR